MPLPWPTFPILASRLVSAFRGDYNDMLNALVTAFAGPDPPPALYAGMFWLDTSASPKLLKQRNTGNTAWIIRGQAEVDYGGALPLAGGTMAGGIDMGGFPVTGLGAGSGNAAARVADLAAYAKLGTGGDAAAAFAKIPDLSQVPGGQPKDPSSDDQLARKKYVDDTARAGGTFTNQITMPVAPGAGSMHVARKIDLESAIDAHIHSGAAGAGQRLPSTSLANAGATEGDQLRAQATGSPVVWSAPVALLYPVGATLFNTGATSGITTVDLSATVPATARAAILLVEFSSTMNSAGVAFYVQLDLRKMGASSFQTYFHALSVPSGIGNGTLSVSRKQVLVELDSAKKFQWRTTQVGGAGANVKGDLAGWI